MPKFSLMYRYADPTPNHPKAINVGAKTVEADDEDDARFKLTGDKDLKNVKGLRITSVVEIA